MGLLALFFVCLTAGVQAQATKPVLRALMPNQAEDYNTYPVSKSLEELTGYKVNYEMLPRDKPEDKLNLVIASGEAYDFVLTVYNYLKPQFAEYARRGALTDLGPLLDKYGPLLKSKISEANWDVAAVNGKIYGIPSMNSPVASYTILIRQDWLDKLGLKSPETADELVTTLRAFRDKDPGGNGKLNIPMVFSAIDLGLQQFSVFGSAFGVTNEWNDVGGKLVNRVTDARYKELVAYMQLLYKEGLVDKDFAVNKSATVDEKFTSGRAGAMIVHWASIPYVIDPLLKNFPNAKYSYLKPLKGKNGKAGVSYAGGVGLMTLIPKASKNAVETIKYLNAKLEPKTFLNLVLGVEGVTYRVENGAYFPILPAFNEQRNRGSNYMTGMDESVFPTYWQARVRKDMRLFDCFQWINSFTDSFAMDYAAIAPFLPNSSKNIPQLGSMVNDTLVQIIVGQEPPATIDALAKKWRAGGGDMYEKEINEWYVTYKAATKASK